MKAKKSFGAFTLAANLTATGDQVGIFGVSGSGKSTLVSMLAGLLDPDSGEIQLDSLSVHFPFTGGDAPHDRHGAGL